MTGRVAVIGDVGGHLDVFTDVLAALDVDLGGCQLPDDLQIVHVGDLVHKGPDDAVVALADRLLKANPGRWVQLLGNHEAHYLGGPYVSERRGVRPIGAAARATLRRWFDDGTAHLAASLQVGGRDVLVTHAGLTAGLWDELGRPGSAHDAALDVNALAFDPTVAFRPGWLMTGVVDAAAGVTCVRTGTELATPWLAIEQMPFDQIHGHEGVWWWPDDSWHHDTPDVVRRHATVDHDTRTCWVDVGAKTLRSVDWVLGIDAPRCRWRPLVLPGEVRVPR